MQGRFRVSEGSSRFLNWAACITVMNALQRNAMPADAFLRTATPHSLRSATTGSTAAACRVGTKHAASATSARKREPQRKSLGPSRLRPTAPMPECGLSRTIPPVPAPVRRLSTQGPAAPPGLGLPARVLPMQCGCRFRGFFAPRCLPSRRKCRLLPAPPRYRQTGPIGTRTSYEAWRFFRHPVIKPQFPAEMAR